MGQSEHQADEELKSAQSRMVESEYLASLGQLVASVAHEINNPLALVSNNVAVFERDLRDLIAPIGRCRRATEPGCRTSAGRGDGDGISDADRAAINWLCEQLDLDFCLKNLPRMYAFTGRR